MSVLGTIAKPEKRPPIITLCGDAGTGKSSLAATFPNPIFIRAEDGVGRIDASIAVPDAFPMVTCWADIEAQLMALLTEPHEYKTLVVDSVSKLEEIFTREILANDGRAKTLATALGGYGAGYQALAGYHGRVRKAAGAINERRGMAVVFISHADVETMRPPDSEDYTRYSLRLNPKSIAHYIDDVDLVGYVRLQTAVRGEDGERKRVVSDGTRELVCHVSAATVGKNGLGITEPLEIPPGGNPLMPYFAQKSASKPRVKAKVVQAQPDEMPEPEMDDDEGEGEGFNDSTNSNIEGNN